LRLRTLSWLTTPDFAKIKEHHMNARVPRFDRAVLAVALAAGVLFAATAADAQSTLPVGSTINTQLTSADINTKNAKDGDRVTMQVVAPYPNDNASFAGATVNGHVADVRSAGQGKAARLVLAFDSITFANGRNEPVSGSVLHMDSKKDNTTARKALGSAAGAAVGSQTIGRILGGSAGSVVGLLGGAAAGLAYASNNKANFNVATGAHVAIQTNSTVAVPLRQAGQ